MANSKLISESGDNDIDALLLGSVWDTGKLTFSFPTSASFYDYSGQSYNEASQKFQALTPTLQNAIREALTTISQYANLSFSEISETGTQHADLRFALATPLQLDGLAIGYFPNDGAKSGDVWLDSGGTHLDEYGVWGNPMPGTAGFRTITHEILHALGFSHPGLEMTPNHVGWDYTIMSYQSYPDAPLDIISSAPQTPMIADVAALQYMYGANFKTNATDTIYQWSPTTGELFINGVGQGAPSQKTIYMTLWDGGGSDTYDFSNYSTDVTADLRPGEWSSPAFTPDNLARNQVAILETKVPFDTSICRQTGIYCALSHESKIDPQTEAAGVSNKLAVPYSETR